MYTFEVFYPTGTETIARGTYAAISGARRYFESRGFYVTGIDAILAGKVARNLSAVYNPPSH